jgi:copper oxidase (laccase) domain-containing protein/uncharacterized protein YbaR (Trm112 family)
LVHVIVSSAGEGRPHRDWFEALPFRPAVIAAPEQLHTALVAEVGAPGWFPGVDGLCSAAVTLCVRTADCVPLALMDGRGPLRVLIHAGRAGIGAGIVEAGVAALVAHGVRREAIRAAAGPHINRCCYRFPLGVGAASIAAQEIPTGATVQAGHLVVDLSREIGSRLRRLEIGGGFSVDGRCTCCHPSKLPSHRREGDDRRRSLLSLSGWSRKEHDMSVDPELVSILACPETKEPVELAPDEMIATLNDLIKKGEVRNRGGDAVNEPIDGGLVREDRRFLYAIREDIPIMLIEEAIELPPLGL